MICACKVRGKLWREMRKCDLNNGIGNKWLRMVLSFSSPFQVLQIVFNWISLALCNCSIICQSAWTSIKMLTSQRTRKDIRWSYSYFNCKHKIFYPLKYFNIFFLAFSSCRQKTFFFCLLTDNNYFNLCQHNYLIIPSHADYTRPSKS